MNPPHHVNGSLSKTGSVILLLVISTSSVFLSVALVPLREPEEVLMKLKATLQRKLCTHTCSEWRTKLMLCRWSRRLDVHSVDGVQVDLTFFPNNKKKNMELQNRTSSDKSIILDQDPYLPSSCDQHSSGVLSSLEQSFPSSSSSCRLKDDSSSVSLRFHQHLQVQHRPHVSYPFRHPSKHPSNCAVKQTHSSHANNIVSNQLRTCTPYFLLFLISCCFAVTSAAITEQCLRCICQVSFPSNFSHEDPIHILPPTQFQQQLS